MEGLSIRSMVVNACFQIVILAYLADNDTSMMVLASNGLGLVIEFWKISKAITVSFADGKIQWEETKSYSQSKTKQYDEIAMNHLLYITFPLVSGYGCYSLGKSFRFVLLVRGISVHIIDKESKKSF